MSDLYTEVGSRLFELVWRSSTHRPNDLETCKLAEEGAIIAVQEIAGMQLVGSGLGASLTVAGRLVRDSHGRHAARRVQAFAAFAEFLSAAGLVRRVASTSGRLRSSCGIRLSKAFCMIFRDAFDGYLDQLPKAGLNRRGFQACTAATDYYDCIGLAAELQRGPGWSSYGYSFAVARALAWATFAEMLARDEETIMLTFYHGNGDEMEFVLPDGQRLRLDRCDSAKFQQLMMHCYTNRTILSVNCCSDHTMVGIDRSFVRKVRRSLGLGRLFDMHAEPAVV